jgi:hypothetical protein
VSLDPVRNTAVVVIKVHLERACRLHCGSPLADEFFGRTAASVLNRRPNNLSHSNLTQA